jgi:hypothetical protein
MSPTETSILKPCLRVKPKSATASKRLVKSSTSRSLKPPKHGASTSKPFSSGNKASASPAGSISKKSKKSSARPGCELVEISTEFANSLRACVEFFEYRGTIGEFLEREADWVFENLLKDTSSGGEVREFLEYFRLRSKGHAQRVAERFNTRCAAVGEQARAEAFRASSGWELEFYNLDYLHWNILHRWCRRHGHEFEPYRLLALENGSKHAPDRIMAITAEGEVK